MIEASEIKRLAGVRHGFFTRRGGTSGGLYDSLNCGLGSGDRPECVAANRERAMAGLGRGGADLATAYQVHSAVAVAVDKPWGPGRQPKVDGLATRTPGVVLGILTADCAPILLADAEGGVIGAAHAGWKGALGGVIEATVACMEGLGARRGRIQAAVGPCIHQASYEVGAEFRQAFLEGDPANAAFFVAAQRVGHFQFDLPGYVGRRLAGLGLASIDVLDFDTCADPDNFFSFRRATKRGETDYGRGLSAIALAG